MAERHTIETYGRAPHDRNIWSTATERHTIETYGRHAWPILLSVLVISFIPLLWQLAQKSSFSLQSLHILVHWLFFNCTFRFYNCTNCDQLRVKICACVLRGDDVNRRYNRLRSGTSFQHLQRVKPKSGWKFSFRPTTLHLAIKCTFIQPTDN